MTSEILKIQDEFRKKLVRHIETPATLNLPPETAEEAVERANFNREILDIASETTETAFFFMQFFPNGDIRKIRFSQNFRRLIHLDDTTPVNEVFDRLVNILHPEDKEMTLEAFFMAFAGCRNFKIKIRAKTGDKEYGWFENSGVCRTYPDGTPRIVFFAYSNITSEEVENKDLMGRLEAMIGGVDGGLMVTKMDIGFPYLYISEAVAALQGYTPDELFEITGGEVTRNIYPEDSQRINDEVVAILGSNKDTLHMTYRVQHKDGHLIWVNDYGKITRMPDGSVRVYSLVQDMTGQVVASERLALERAQYQEALVRNAITTFCFDVTDNLLREKIILDNDEDVLARLGETLPLNLEKLARSYQENEQISISEKDQWLFKVDELRKRYEQGKTGGLGEFYNPVIDKWVRVQTLLYADFFTGHIMCRYICTDVTFEKKAEENQRKALMEATRQAEKANLAKTVFLSNMSHDIRTPMNAIMGYTTLAKNHIDDKEKMLDYLNKIQSSGNHLLQLINDVLDMSRIESGTVVLDETKIDLMEELEGLWNIAVPGARDKGITVNFNSDYKNNIVYVDQLRLNQVLINCLGNAIKFTPDGGRIDVNLVEKPGVKVGYGEFEFHVKDTGIGMSDEFKEHLFEPFSRERNSTVSGIQGTGLGMAITKSIVDVMGGSIEVNSKKGIGTEFIIKLSLRLASGEETRNAEKEVAYVGAPGTKVLLVEDNAINREIATEILKDGGVIVTAVNDGVEAVEAVKNMEPGEIDIILMDVQMPVMNGMEATREIRALPEEYWKKIPIIAMTANAFEEDRRATLAAGMNAHLTKPIVVAELWKTINEMLQVLN